MWRKDRRIMKKKNTLNVVIGLVSAVFLIVAICVMMAPAFSDTTRGNMFHVMFGSSSSATNVVIPLVVAFSLDCLTLILSFLVPFLKDKGRTGLYVFIAALNLISAIVFLCSIVFFKMYNVVKVDIDYLGAGTITSVVFNFLVVALMLVGIILNKKPAETDED
jgi:hypothetical protein